MTGLQAMAAIGLWILIVIMLLGTLNYLSRYDRRREDKR